MSIERVTGTEGLTTESGVHGRIAIEDASSWVLRVGVLVSLAVMFIGLGAEFAAGQVSLQLMESESFSDNFGAMLRGVAALNGFALMEFGIMLLVLTPILRVFTAMVLFAVEERDHLYTIVTSIVLVLTLSSLLVLR